MVERTEAPNTATSLQQAAASSSLAVAASCKNAGNTAAAILYIYLVLQRNSTLTFLHTAGRSHFHRHSSCSINSSRQRTLPGAQYAPWRGTSAVRYERHDDMTTHALRGTSKESGLVDNGDDGSQADQFVLLEKKKKKVVM